jgi:hypothetical protein
MNRMLKTMALGLLLAALTLAVPAQVHAQVIIQSAPVYAPAPIVTTYPAYYGPRYAVPSIAYSAPVTYSYSAPIATYSAPRVSYYPAPVAYSVPIATTYSGYAAPVVAYSAPIATTYSGYAAPVVAAPAAGVYTTYTYWNGLGIFRPRYVNQTYYTPVLP